MTKKRKVVAFILCGTILGSVSPHALADGIEKPNQFYWPTSLDLGPLRFHNVESNPYGADYQREYHKKFSTLNLAEVRADILKVITTSQDWWPADYGNYGPFFIRMAWHNAGTYRTLDGRGGEEGAQQRFAELNSWPDNASLDKARRLLWPVKQKYGEKLSWGDLIVLTGDVALTSMGFKTLGFVGGRPDDWQSELVYWGPGTTFFPSKSAIQGKFDAHGEAHLEKPLGATNKGLIYVNPEGPGGVPDPAAAAKMIRLAFGRMAMDDEETVALIAGGHTFGKAHGAAPSSCVGPAPEAAPVEQQGLGWKNNCVKSPLKATDAITSGLEGAWSSDPIHFTSQYLVNLLAYDWVQTKSPAGATQWVPKNAANVVPDASEPTNRAKMHPLMMFTTDIALKTDPAYRAIIERWAKNPKEFADAFARAWFKLVVRDMGPQSRYFGSEMPSQTFLWQDPLPKAEYAQINQADIAILKSAIAASGLSNREMIKTAWAAAASHRTTDHRGGANGARVALEPQDNWAVNDPEELKGVLAKLKAVKDHFNAGQHGGRQVSLADVIVLAGNVGLEAAAHQAGVTIHVPFAPGRVDATQAQTDVASFAVLEPTADAFRNYYRSVPDEKSPTEALVDRASTLDLTIPEMTVLLGGMRSLDVNAGHSPNGVLTNRPGQLTNDFLVNVLSMDTRWEKAADQQGVYEGFDRKTGAKRWTATDVDLVFGANSELRATAEAYASADSQQKFYSDFVKAWTKVMTLDRFDLQR
ncbi:catalase/peroxidase HPI [Acidomonas methanolica]|uniref:Catalase-peroxidase n=1 Tax=Acidomonas methanolica NBRC 104435 TaxID=1231351 RepID=A0A023D9C4_ACIMT|nr:catalase/peroxidase HPI [Acidomonas methanolica]MBU2654782.1 catalase/peroxidase HPI [Acidomonas methanolica]TCS26360.1 catalase-peroxidase [Acidomonas methanolica]GAJ30411.1 catalase/peroxidase [Acidomonas methanolica NBRC 104435]